jgi:hypothetical protein
VAEHAELAGHTLSSEIDESLRRTYWRERAYAEAQERLFGSVHALALGYLLARIVTGIEHDMQTSVHNSDEVRTEVEDGSTFVLAAVMARWRGIDGPDPLGAAPSEPVLRETGELRPWQRVVLAVHDNLTSDGDELWWPLSARAQRGKRVTDPPLSPTIAVLRELWPCNLGATAQSTHPNLVATLKRER